MRKTLAALMALGLLAAPMTANAFSNKEKAELDEHIRSYLMDNPEVIIQALQEFEKQQQARAAELEKTLVADNTDAIFEDGYSRITGNLDGDLTLVEFLDYRCGFCKKAHEEVKSFLEADGNIRMIVKEFPILGPDSLVASKAALASLRQKDGDLYDAYSDAMMTHKGNLDAAAVMSIADKVGLDVKALEKDMEDEAITEMIQQTYQLAQKLDINGTPAFILGEQVVRGYVPGEQLAGIAAEEREKAKN